MLVKKGQGLLRREFHGTTIDHDPYRRFLHFQYLERRRSARSPQTGAVVQVQRFRWRFDSHFVARRTPISWSVWIRIEKR
jgi:hypothetical protein